MKKIFFTKERIPSFSGLICFFVLSLPVFSQNNSSGWTINNEPQKNFIENKSQFNGRDKIAGLPAGQAGSEILFGVDQNGSQIYFTKQGLTYRFDVKQKKNEKESEKERAKENKKMTAEEWIAHEKQERKVKYETDIVNMQWENSNPNVQVVAEEEISAYYSYLVGKENFNYVKAYKKLVYKNLYPNIDVEYVFLEGKEGVKYSLILHPGADVSQIKMVYTSLRAERSNLTVDAEGNIHIPTKFGDIIDHSPQTFYADTRQTISSFFSFKNNIVSFSLPNGEGRTGASSIIIDPWSQTPTMAASNAVQECERDGAGNVYIIGGETPMKLMKYNSAGVWQWTYATPYDTSNGGDWLGTFATDLLGNSYVTCGSTAALTKVNTNAGVVYSVTGGTNDEYWNIAFNCDQTKLIIGGTRLTFNTMLQITGSGVIYDINTTNGSVNSMKTVAYTTPGFGPIANPNEVRSITSSYNGRYYYLTLDTIGCIDQNFSACSAGGGPIFEFNSGYKFAYKCENYRPNNGNGGIMSIRANKFFVYTANGTNIQKRSLATGAILGTAPIPAGINVSSFGFNQIGNSGIDIDTCGNVYVGTNQAVIKYDANLNQLASFTVPFTVYDVAVSINGDVIAAGAVQNNSAASRTGYVQSISTFAACNPLKLICCDATICTAGPFCATDPPQTLSSSTSGGTWSGTGITNTSTGVFSPSVSGTGTFTITYNIPCGSDSMTIIVNNCTAPTICLEPNGDLTVSGGAGPTYTWSVWTTGGSTPITNQAQCTACNPAYTWFAFPPPGQCLNGVTPVTSCTTAASYQQFATGSTVTPPGNWPIQVVDGSGNTVILNSTSGLPSCSSVLTAAIVHTNVLCNGQCTGTSNVTVTNGTSPYTYAWSPSGGNSSAATGLCAGTYTVLVSDAASVTTTATVTITQPAAILSSTATSTSASCGSGGTAAVTAAGGTPNYTYAWSPSGGNSSAATGLSAGNYTATVTDANGCTSTSTVSITSASGGTVSVNSPNITCNGGTTTATATMSGGTSPFTYLWSGGQTTSSVTGLSVGSYTVTVTDANGCTNSQSVNITQPSAITSSVTVTNTTCGASTGTAQVTASGGTGTLSYSWSNGPTTTSITGLGVGTYTCTIMDGNGCTQTQTANIANSNGPSVTTSPTNPTCTNSTDGSASATVTGGTTPYTYLWNTSPPQTTQNATGLSAGTYTVTVTDASGCSNIQTVTLTSSGPIAVAGTSTVIAPGGSASLTASGGVTYSWSPSTGLNNSNISNPVATINQTTLYCVFVTDINGCIDSACVTIYVETPCGNNYYFPNAFSPNGDNENDVLKIFVEDTQCIREYQLDIYDRWGEKLFTTISPAEPWYGTKKGKTMDTQVVAYYLHIIFVDGTEISKQGNVSLVR